MSQLDSNESGFTPDELKSIQEQIKEYDFKSGVDDLEIFLMGPVWDDFKGNMEDRIQNVHAQLENVGNTPIEDAIYKGILHELRQLLDYPNKVIELLKLLEV